MKGKFVYAYMISFVTLLVAGFLYFFGGADHVGDTQPAGVMPVETGEEEVIPPEPFVVSSLAPDQGDTVLVKLLAEERPALFFGGKAVDVFKIVQGTWVGIIGVDTKATPGLRLLEARLGSETATKTIEVVKKDWLVTELTVSEELVEQGYTPRTITAGVADENAVIARTTAASNPAPYFSGKFTDPLARRINVGAFGNVRKSGGTSIQHLGVDLEAETGTRVYAINDGVVVFARSGLPNYGTTVVVDHGLGIFSLYLHLSELKVSVGDAVKRGGLVALSGSTGYSLEPHLHFSIHVRGASVDPTRFIDAVNGFLE